MNRFIYAAVREGLFVAALVIVWAAASESNAFAAIAAAFALYGVGRQDEWASCKELGWRPSWGLLRKVRP